MTALSSQWTNGVLTEFIQCVTAVSLPISEKGTGKMLKKIVVSIVLACMLGGLASAQTLTHSVTLNWLDPNNPTGTTYNVYRAVGLCGGTPTFSKLASGVTAKTYNDSAVAPGNYCYQVTASVTSIEGPPSNTINPQVQPFVVTLTFTQQ